MTNKKQAVIGYRIANKYHYVYEQAKKIADDLNMLMHEAGRIGVLSADRKTALAEAVNVLDDIRNETSDTEGVERILSEWTKALDREATGEAHGGGEGLHRVLSPNNETQFRKWARDHFDVTSGRGINGLWHPVVIDECQKMKSEYREKGGKK